MTIPSACAGLGLSANPNLIPGLVPYDLTCGGSLFHFGGRRSINQSAINVQDSIRLVNLMLNAGLRFDAYYALRRGSAVSCCR